MKKRGMSAVVTTLIIILLAIVAVGIVWVVVKNIIDKGREDITLTGLTLDLEIQKAVFDDKDTPETDDDTLSITVKRNAGDGNLVGINFIFGDGDNSVVVTEDTTLAELGVKTFIFYTDTLAVGEITSVSIAPIFEASSGKDVTGEIKDTTTSTSGDLGTGDPDYGGTPGGGDPPACTPECTGLDCGDDGCEGSCGTCDIGYSCAENQTCMDVNCVPTFLTCESQGYNCSTILDSCGDEIDCAVEWGGDCTDLYNESWVCSNHVCVYEPACIDTCESENLECGIQEICGEEVDCEVQTGGCDSGFECVPENDLCQVITYINSGSVMWSGPPSVNKLFSGDNLLNESSYAWNFAALPGLVSPYCYPISDTKPGDDMYAYVILTIITDDAPLDYLDIIGEDYQIWENFGECCASLTDPNPECTL